MCTFPGCDKAYSSAIGLNQHIRTKHNQTSTSRANGGGAGGAAVGVLGATPPGLVCGSGSMSMSGSSEINGATGTASEVVPVGMPVEMPQGLATQVNGHSGTGVNANNGQAVASSAGGDDATDGRGDSIYGHNDASAVDAILPNYAYSTGQPEQMSSYLDAGQPGGAGDAGGQADNAFGIFNSEI